MRRALHLCICGSQPFFTQKLILQWGAYIYIYKHITLHGGVLMG